MRALWYIIQILGIALAFLGVLALVDFIAGSFLGVIVSWLALSFGAVFAVRWALK